MSALKQVEAHVPFLRRYARALTGTQKSGDAYIVAVLEVLIADISAFDTSLPARVALYKLFTSVWNSVSVNGESGSKPVTTVDRRLDIMTPRSRQAFLLFSMERFDERDIGTILNCSLKEVRRLIALANREIAEQVATDVLIIEDEPLIAMDLESIMAESGHRIVGVARTHAEALKLAAGKKIGLILADIQLTDGSSGIAAVNDLLNSIEAPVIFITAFPERLLTGRSVEPTYLLSKPFQAPLVAALSSQALFFGENARRLMNV